jgi:uncharacterized protein (TIGR02421 family)
MNQNKRVRRRLPVSGHIHIDRPLPFLCIYRDPGSGRDPGTARLVTSEASYLTCTQEKRFQADLTALVRAVAQTLVDQFGSCLLLEVWAGPPTRTSGPITTEQLTPQFCIVAPKAPQGDLLTDDFVQALARVKVGSRRASVTARQSARCAPPGLRPILSGGEVAAAGCLLYGLEITPIYRAESGQEVFPAVLRQLRRSLTVALRRFFFEFARKQTTHRPEHYHALGRNAVVKAVWEVDRLLAEASAQFDFLLQLTPVNGEQAWQEFQRGRFQQAPSFHYRPIPAEPVVLKRNLFKAPVERIEDPALGQLFREKLDELDRQITMLIDRNTSRFLHESIQLYGPVTGALQSLAVEILERVPSRSRDEAGHRPWNPAQFADRAAREVEFLRSQHEGVGIDIQVRDDITGLMVSRGNLLIGSEARIPAARVEALIQHEVGTHALTYHNGRCQRFQQLYTGLAGYDALQEGLAVLAEYLVGGLSRPRLRLLAARVVAVKALIDGATFVETFRELDRRYDFARHTAFTITMRVFRGGGLTKDAVYLRGLVEILDYVSGGGDLETLLVGKIATRHIPIIRELQWRDVLADPPLRPRYLDQPDARQRLVRVRRGVTVLDLVGTAAQLPRCENEGR